jgi:hypothetical protein
MSSDLIFAFTRAQCVRVGLAGLLALGCMAAIPRLARSEDGHREFREHKAREHEFREHEFHRQEFRDTRYHHDHYYPPRGYLFRVLPPNPRLIVHRGQPYYFSAGVWYQPVEGHYVVVRPPIGILVPFLPPFYSRVWVGPRPYYYANDVYYVRGAQGYVVVDQPPGVISIAPPPGMPLPPDDAVTELGPASNSMPAAVAATPPVTAIAPSTNAAQAGDNQLFVYPRQGQSAEQQNRDRSECNSWAIGQTGSNASSSGEQMNPAFMRALGACLDGRGYTVK